MSRVVADSVQSLLTKPDSWKSTRSLDDDDDDDEAWFDEEDDELLPGGGESLATPCMIAARLSPDCDQINQYLDKGLLLFFCFHTEFYTAHQKCTTIYFCGFQNYIYML